MAGAPFGSTSQLKNCLGNATSDAVPITPNTVQRKSDSLTRCWALSLSPDATADATSGAVMVGRNAIRKYNVNDAELAAAMGQRRE